MTPVTHPSKEQVRQWLQQRQAERKPLPSQEEIRRQLGFGLNKSAERSR